MHYLGTMYIIYSTKAISNEGYEVCYVLSGYEIYNIYSTKSNQYEVQNALFELQNIYYEKQSVIRGTRYIIYSI